jgi:8-oxo-dGTP pyrophosphatase MutT (NUDIX family)
MIAGIGMSARDIRYQAAVIDGQRLLLLRCAPWDEAPFWVLPGGGREAGESAEACVAREVREEAGIEVAVGPLLYEMPADPPDGTYTRWRTYLCRVTAGTAVRWLPLDDPAGWDPELCADPFIHPQLLRIRAALQAAPAPYIADPENEWPHTGAAE